MSTWHFESISYRMITKVKQQVVLLILRWVPATTIKFTKLIILLYLINKITIELSVPGLF